MARRDSKETLDTKINILKGAKTYLNRDDSIVEWSYALQLTPEFRKYESYSIRQELHHYVCAALGDSLNYFWWLKENRPEEKRSEKECMIAWIEWMISCLREDLQAIAEEERSRRNWNPVTHPNGPPRAREERDIIIILR